MYLWHWIVETFRENPSIPIFLTIAVGFWIGKFKYKTFTLGTVTSVLLVGVLVGQMDIPISGPLKSVFFLLFLFAIGYSVGPQFFQSLKGSGIKQVIFTLILCVLCLGVTYAAALLLHYNPGEAAGLLSGAQTISAVIGVATDSISTFSDSPEVKKAWIDIIPVCYAVTYIFGTIGSAYILGVIGPWMLGGLQKVKEDTKKLAQEMNRSELSDDPAYLDANQPISFRAYKVTADLFKTPQTVKEIEDHLKSLGRRLFVEKIRTKDGIVDPVPTQTVGIGDEIVLSGRHEYIIEDESWIGPEVDDPRLLSFPVESVPVMLTKKTGTGETVDELMAQPYMYGISIQKIKRGGVEIPVFAQTKLMAGDILTIEGLPQEVDLAAPKLGYVDKPTTKTDLIFVGLGIVIGSIIGAITIHAGGVPISLSTSGGALIAGLVMGWMRSKHPTYGMIPSSSLWLMNNLGLNMFIAVIGISAGPTFISGIKEVGFMLFVAGVVCTSLPLFIGVWMGDKIFKFRPAINLGCNAGGRTTTAALGAVQDSLDSTIPAMGYTVTYAIGNTLLILWGVVIVLLVH